MDDRPQAPVQPSSTAAARGRPWLATAIVVTITGAGLAWAIPAAPALAGTTAASTFFATGNDAATGSTADSTTGTTGTTAPDQVLDWQLHYANVTSSPASVTIDDAIGPGQSFVPGSLRMPPGLAPSWSTDSGASYTATEPATGVDALRVAGRMASPAGGVSTFPTSEPSFSGTSTAGNGYEALFFGANIYNVHHGAVVAGGNSTLMDCHVKATGAVCPGFAPTGVYASLTPGTPFTTDPTGLPVMITPQSSSSVIDQATGRIFTAVSVVAGAHFDYGILCLDVATGASCGFDLQGSRPVNSVNEGLSGATGVGTRVYDTDLDGVVHCFDYATGASCGTVAAFPGYTNPGGAADRNGFFTRTEAFGPFVFVNFGRLELDVANPPRFLSCIDTRTLARCPGYPIATPVAAGVDNVPMAPVLSTSGSVTGLCASSTVGTTATWVCFDPAGARIANPYPALAPGVIGAFGFGDSLTIGTKVYLPYQDDTQYTCLDFATSPPVACAGFFNPPHGGVLPYTLRADPFNPACIWAVGNNGVFDNFNATTGLPCADSQTSVSVDPSRYYCSGSAPVTSWEFIDISGLPAADYAGATLTVEDSAGAPVAGFVNRVLTTAQQHISISTIPSSGPTSALRAVMTLTRPTPGLTPSLSMSFSGPPVQVCFQTRTADACPTTAAVAAVNSATAITTADSGVTDAPAGNASGPAEFDVVTDQAACGLVITKTSDVSSAAPGDRVGYTVSIQNAGTIPYASTDPASWSDDLSGVLPDAVYNGDAHATSGASTFASPRLSWSGPLAPGQIADVTYSVTVDQTPGAAGILNSVSSNDPFANCQPDTGDPACTSDITVFQPPPPVDIANSLAAVNGSGYDGQPVHAGDVLTYAIAVRNLSDVDTRLTLFETVGVHQTHTGADQGWSPGCTTSGTACSQVVDVAAASTTTAEFTTSIDASTPAGTTITNTVSAPTGCSSACTVNVSTEPISSAHPVAPTSPKSSITPESPTAPEVSPTGALPRTGPPDLLAASLAGAGLATMGAALSAASRTGIPRSAAPRTRAVVFHRRRGSGNP